MMTRRNFITQLAASGTLCTLLPSELLASPFKGDIGIQLYSIRDLVSQDFQGSLEKLSKIGYATIETANYQDGRFYGMEPPHFKGVVESFGLRATSSHSALTLDNIAKTAEDTARAGMSYLVQPSIPEHRRRTLDDYKTVAMELNRMGEICRKMGLTLGYHNHAYEFERLDGEIPYDVLLGETDPGLVTMQLDTYWAYFGGFDPADYMKKHPGRFKMWHIKDMSGEGDRKSTEIGSGILDFKSIFDQKETAGFECLFVEQEHFEMDPWDSLAISWNYLNNL